MRSISIQPHLFLFTLLAMGFTGCSPSHQRACINCSLEDGPSYHASIKPILAQHCTGCHQPGGIAPYDYTKIEVVKAHASLIWFAMKERTMPPFGADNSGECNTFKNARWVTDEEISTVKTWLDAGAPEGLPTAPMPPADQNTVIPDPDLALTAPEKYYPTFPGNEDEFRCILIPNSSLSNQYIKEFQYVPSEGAELIDHHALIGQTLNATSEADLIALDQMSPEPGFPCSAGMGINNVRTLAIWAPGMAPFKYPDGAGVLFESGRMLMIQLHLSSAINNGGPPIGTQPTIQMKFQTGAAVEVKSRILRAQQPGGIPPGWVTIAKTWTVPSRMQAVGYFPHMHLLGKSAHYTYIPPTPSPEFCMINVDRFDFNWQQIYFPEDMPILEPGGVVDYSMTWNNTTGQTVPFGDQTEDEMGALLLYYIDK